jgi:hypothetical protein
MFIALVAAAAGGVALGSFAAAWRYDARAREALYQNYTDRGRICLEAAALVRANQPLVAQRFLEQQTDASIAGVAMWRAYDELSADGQAFMVSAKIYDQSYQDVNFDLTKRIRGGIPNDHRWLSTSMRGIAGKLSN